MRRVIVAVVCAVLVDAVVMGLNAFPNAAPPFVILCGVVCGVVLSGFAVTVVAGWPMGALFGGMLLLAAVPSWGMAGTSDLVLYQAASIAAFCALFGLVSRSRLAAVALFLLVLVFFVFVEVVLGGYHVVTGHDISQPQIMAISDTNVDEALGYLRANAALLPFALAFEPDGLCRAMDCFLCVVFRGREDRYGGVRARFASFYCD